MRLIAGPAQIVTQWVKYNILFILARALPIMGFLQICFSNSSCQFIGKECFRKCLGRTLTRRVYFCPVGSYYELGCIVLCLFLGGIPCNRKAASTLGGKSPPHIIFFSEGEYDSPKTTIVSKLQKGCKGNTFFGSFKVTGAFKIIV